MYVHGVGIYVTCVRVCMIVRDYCVCVRACVCLCNVMFSTTKYLRISK